MFEKMKSIVSSLASATKVVDCKVDKQQAEIDELVSFDFLSMIETKMDEACPVEVIGTMYEYEWGNGSQPILDEYEDNFSIDGRSLAEYAPANYTVIKIPVVSTDMQFGDIVSLENGTQTIAMQDGYLHISFDDTTFDGKMYLETIDFFEAGGVGSTEFLVNANNKIEVIFE